MDAALATVPQFSVAPGADIGFYCSITPIGPVALPLVWKVQAIVAGWEWIKLH